MIGLSATDKLAASASTAATVNFAVSGAVFSTPDQAVPQYKVLAEGQVAATPQTMYTPGRAATHSAEVSSIHLFNTSATTQTVKVYVNGGQIAAFSILAGGFATYSSGEWVVYTSDGAQITVGSVGPTGPAGGSGSTGPTGPTGPA